MEERLWITDLELCLSHGALFHVSYGQRSFASYLVLPLTTMFFLPVGVEGGFDITEEKFEYDEDVKIVIFPEHLDIPRDGLEGLPDMVRDRVCLRGELCFLSVGRKCTIAEKELLSCKRDPAELL